tara:strand:+ start:129 stop:275 length:147 start_codon:yes stop_codon:yes gene_type:complete
MVYEPSNIEPDVLYHNNSNRGYFALVWDTVFGVENKSLSKELLEYKII